MFGGIVFISYFYITNIHYMKNIAIVGSRNFTDKDILNKTLNEVISIEGTPSKIVSGGAKGADSMGYDWAVENNIETLIKNRDEIVEKVFKYKNEDGVKAPIAFQYIIQNIQGQLNLLPTSAVDIKFIGFSNRGIYGVHKIFCKRVNA